MSLGPLILFCEIFPLSDVAEAILLKRASFPAIIEGGPTYDPNVS